MKKILFGLVGLIAVLVIVLGVLVFVSPTDFKVERDVVINKPKAEVFDYLKFVKNQNKWGPWMQRDPKIKMSYSGTDGEVGFISKWESDHEEVGTGEQEITKIVDGERVDVELRFIKPWEATNKGFLITEDAGEGKTKVRWGFSGTMDRPMNLMLVFTDFEAIIGKDFQDGLDKLKSIVEKQASPEAEKEATEDGGKKEDQKTNDAKKKTGVPNG